MRVVGAVSARTGGDLAILGLDPNDHGPDIRSQLGVVPQQDSLDQELRVRDDLLAYGRYFGLPRSVSAERADALLEFAQLADRTKAKVDDLSGGTKRRLTIAGALINEPRMLLLDEPTTGLDPQARHILCDRLVVVDKGRIMAEGSPTALIRDYSSKEVLEVRFGNPLIYLFALGVGLAIGTAISSYASTIQEDRGQMAMLQRLGITPLFLFSGTFFPLEQPRASCSRSARSRRSGTAPSSAACSPTAWTSPPGSRPRTSATSSRSSRSGCGPRPAT